MAACLLFVAAALVPYIIPFGKVVTLLPLLPSALQSADANRNEMNMALARFNIFFCLFFVSFFQVHLMAVLTVVPPDCCECASCH